MRLGHGELATGARVHVAGTTVRRKLGKECIIQSQQRTPGRRRRQRRIAHSGRLGGKTLATVKVHKGAVRTVAFSADGRLILTASDGDRGARVWDSSTARKIAEVGLEYVQGAAFSPDSRRIATLSSDGRVRFFEWERFAPVEQLVALETMAMLFISEEIGWQRQPTPGQHGHHTLLTKLIVPEPGMGRRHGPVVRREPLGGLLSYYHREAA